MRRQCQQLQSWSCRQQFSSRTSARASHIRRFLLYVSLLLLNWLIATYCALVHLTNPRSALVRVFYSFDLFFAVFAPLQVIVSAYTHFKFDTEEFETRVQLHNPANFDAMARVFADPVQVSLFRTAFRSLQLTSTGSLTVNIVLKVLTIRKWWRTIHVLGEAAEDNAHIVASRQRTPLLRRNRLLAALFFCAGGAVFVYTIGCVVSTTNVCNRFEHCKVPSYRWNVGSQLCSCSVFVDRQTCVKTFAEWEDPIDTTANLAALAGSGDLKVIQVVNRQLPTLPIELRRCRRLEQVSLLYTKTITIPAWFREFEHLEYLHLEGDLTQRQLQGLPDGLFDAMPKLAFLHLGCLPRIPSVPNLSGLHRLTYLALALLHSVTAFPSFDRLENLERLAIIDAPHATELPSFARLHKLYTLIIFGRNAFCCNGFYDGVCDLDSYSCRDRSNMGEPRVVCTSARLNPSDRALMDRLGPPPCDKNWQQELAIPATREDTDVACGGVMYRQCTMWGIPGICYPSRMMVIGCQLDPAYSELRRLQIQRSVGEPCDPVEENWLGCGP